MCERCRRDRVRPHPGRVADRQGPSSEGWGVVVSVGSHRRGDRPAGFGQDAGPADACSAARTRRGAGHVDEDRRSAVEHHRTLPARSGGCTRPFRVGAGVASAGLGSDRRLCGPDTCRAQGEGVHGWHRKGGDGGWPWRRRGAVLRVRGGEGAPVLLPCGRVDRPDTRLRAAVDRQPARRDHTGGDPSGTPTCGEVLARAAARRPQRGRPDRREHAHHRATSHVVVLPGRHPPPLRVIADATWR